MKNIIRCLFWRLVLWVVCFESKEKYKANFIPNTKYLSFEDAACLYRTFVESIMVQEFKEMRLDDEEFF